MGSELELDANALESTANIIEAYCGAQKGLMDEYLANIMSLYSGWNDDKTFGPLLEEIKRMKSNVEVVMDEIRSKYPAYFRMKAEMIRNR